MEGHADLAAPSGLILGALKTGVPTAVELTINRNQVHYSRKWLRHATAVYEKMLLNCSSVCTLNHFTCAPSSPRVF